jgi:hypothetical protein
MSDRTEVYDIALSFLDEGKALAHEYHLPDARVSSRADGCGNLGAVHWSWPARWPGRRVIP